MSEEKVYTLEEVSKHDTIESLWMIIDSKVYDVTSFVNDHPGGGDLLLSSGGKDATDEFLDVGHTQKAVDMLKDYYIGVCNESKKLVNPLSSNPIPAVSETKPVESTSKPVEESNNNNNNKPNNDDDVKVIVGGVIVAAAAIAAVTVGLFKLLKK